MTPGNFNWLLHSMLFYHTKHVIIKQQEKARRAEARRANEGSDSDSDEADDNV
jgi:hypothetical protein